MWSSQCVCLIDQLRIRYTDNVVNINVINIAHESHIRISEMSCLSLLALCKTPDRKTAPLFNTAAQVTFSLK